MIMKYFRDESFVYRDLKPLNVMINDEKYVFIIDFDRLIDENVTQNIEIGDRCFCTIFEQKPNMYSKCVQKTVFCTKYFLCTKFVQKI